MFPPFLDLHFRLQYLLLQLQPLGPQDHESHANLKQMDPGTIHISGMVSPLQGSQFLSSEMCKAKWIPVEHLYNYYAKKKMDFNAKH